MSFSKKSNQHTDVPSIDFQIDISIEIDPILDEFVVILDKIQKNIDSVFKKINVNQFLEFIKVPKGRISNNYTPMVTHVNFDGQFLEVHLLVEYETIEVEGADDL
jgi:hypothetical protein